jgi:hypothetical protein
MDYNDLNSDSCNFDSRPYYPGYKVNKNKMSNRTIQLLILSSVIMNVLVTIYYL